MAIQYPKLTHVTLPSVEQWGQNMNILRDPPKSISTRRIDKVGENTDITDLIDDSGDRICEGISVYSRGINPMVSVSYDNFSNNAGMVGNPTATSGRTQAFLPYPAFENGAFRPPVRNQRDLLPLSRLPRAWFGTTTNAGFADWSKTKQGPNDYRAIKDALNVFNIAPTKTSTLQKGIIENFKMNDTINDKHISIYDTSSGLVPTYQSTYTRENVDVYKGINDNVIEAYAVSNKSRDISQGLEGIEFNKNKYIQDSLSHSTFTNLSSQNTQNLTFLENMDTSKYIQNPLYYDTKTNLSSQQNTQNLTLLENMDTSKYIQGDLLHYDANTNVSSSTIQGLSKLENMNMSKYVQDIDTIEAFSNVSADVSTKRLDELYDNGRVSVKNDMIHYQTNSGVAPTRTFLNEIAQPVLEMRNPNVSVTAQYSDSRIHKRVDHEKELQFEKNIPKYSYKANVTKLEDFNSINLSSREARLAPTLSKGGFNNIGNKPTIERPNLVHHRENDKDRLRQAINDAQFNRFDY